MPGVRTRFAPSPTGHLHIGNVRTALFNWLFARHFNGEFVLRMEDTDTARSDAAFEDSIIEDLSWLGLEWDEGPGGPRGGWGGWGAGSNGPHGPYRQSERLAIYDRHAAALLDKGLAYRCYCSKERLEALKAEQMKKGSPPRYDNRCRSLSPSEIPAGAAPLIRFMVRGRSVRFKDGVHGRMAFDTSAMGDFVIIGSDGVASYNFAVVVDDSEMGITHVLRGDDHLSNTPRQILLFEALGRTVPHYHHLPLVLSPSRSPLGKRDRGASVRGLREGGFLPGAVINTLARLGWSPGGDGLLSLDALARAFDGSRLSKSPSVFDIDRLKSYNKNAIGSMPADELLRLASVEGEGALRAAEAVKANAATLPEFRELIAPFTGQPAPAPEAAEILSHAASKEVIRAAKEAVEHAGVMDEGAYRDIISEVKAATGAKGRALFMPIRAALTGRTEGIELVNVFCLLGRERAAERLGRHAG